VRPRRHARTGFWGKAFQHSGVWVPLVLIVLFIVALALGGPSPRY
jgi:hypothetical protein